ncbi:hypothetical protein [Nocardia sp. NPDC051833]|uniref:hypothetical protein n=1 Tax=Nocardia sp. NPDC051833 TaxID=3155674 RepID=UPI003420FE55
MGSGEDFGSWGAALIWAVLAVTIGVPIWLWTGQELWLVLLLLPGIGFTGVGRAAVWMALAALPRRGIVLAGWSFVLVAVADVVAVSVWKLSPSGWTWPVAVVSALVAGAVMYLAVAAEVVGGWTLTHGAALHLVDSGIAWDKAHPQPDRYSSLLSAGRTTEVIGLRPPPFAIGTHVLADKLGEFHSRIARRHWVVDDTAAALRHAAESTAVRREMVAMPLGRAKTTSFAQSLYEEAFYLDELGRTQEAVTLRAEEIELRRWIVGRFDKKFPTLVAKATRPQAKTTTKRLVIEVEKLGRSMKDALALALRAQADGLSALDRADEATALRAEADTIAPLPG